MDSVEPSDDTEVNSNELHAIGRELSTLIVDDNHVNQMVLSKMLDKWGVSHDVADNGLQALDLIRNKRYDLVFMDIQMPEMDGIQATRFIRTNLKEYGRSLPIFAVSADVLSDYTSERFQKNQLFNGIIHKPFSMTDISNALKGINSIKANPQVSPSQTYSLDLTQLNQLAEDDVEFKKSLVENLMEIIDDTIMQLTSETLVSPKKINKLVHRIRPNADFFKLPILDTCRALKGYYSKPDVTAKDIPSTLIQRFIKELQDAHSHLNHYLNSL